MKAIYNVANGRIKSDATPEKNAAEKTLIKSSSFTKNILILTAIELILAGMGLVYGANTLPHHSSFAAFYYVVFCVLGLAVAALLWYVFIVRRPLIWGRQATPCRLILITALSICAAILLEVGTLIGAPISSPLVLSDWHLSRIAVFFAASIPLLCAIVMYDWRALGTRIKTALLANRALLLKKIIACTIAAILGGIIAGLIAGNISEQSGIGNPYACRLFTGVVAGLVIVLIGLRHSFANRPERPLFAILLSAGFLFSALTPWYTAVSWDDHIHYDRAVSISYAIDPEYTSAEAALVGNAFLDINWYSRDHSSDRINPFNEDRLKDRYHQLDELANTEKQNENNVLENRQSAQSAFDALQEKTATSLENTEETNAEKNIDGYGLIPLGTAPTISNMSDFGFGELLFDGNEPQAIQIDGARTLRDVGTVQYNSIAYIPAAFGLWLSRLLSLPFSLSFFIGKFFTFLSYALVVFFACKRLKSGKMILAVCALVPTTLFLASNYSYDSWLTGFIMLGIAAFVGELQQPNKPLSWRSFLLMVIAFLVGLGPKAIYIPIAAILLFMPRSKFTNKIPHRKYSKSKNGKNENTSIVQRVIAACSNSFCANTHQQANALSPALTHKRYLLIVFISALLVLSTFVLPLFVSGPGGGDSNGGAVNPSNQIAFIAGQPFDYLAVFWHFCEYFFTMGNAPFILTDFCSVETSTYAEYIVYLLLIVALTDRCTRDIPAATHGKRLAMLLLFALTWLLICTALFIDYTPAGWDWIKGVQGRYLLPLLFPVALICLNFKPFCKLGERIKTHNWGRATYNCAILFVSGYLALASIAETIVFNF